MIGKLFATAVIPGVFLLAMMVPDVAMASTAQPKATIAVLGTGDMGDSFGPRLAALGYRVIYGSRTPDSERVQALVERTGHGASADTARNAAHAADIVLLAVAARAVEDVVRSLGDLDSKIIIDLTWPPTEIAEDGYEEISLANSGAEQIQAWQANSMVVKAFGTLGSNGIDNPNVAGGPITVPMASDSRHAKEVVGRIAVELGLDPVDAGPLRHARYIEAMMLLYIVPHVQGRAEGWEYYFRRSNYWQCNPYTGDEFEDNPPPLVDEGNLAVIPSTQGEPKGCR